MKYTRMAVLSPVPWNVIRRNLSLRVSDRHVDVGPSRLHLGILFIVTQITPDYEVERNDAGSASSA
jgi:hypothetical protein